MADYPTKLRNFKAWAKAMEEGATVDRPNYGRTRNGQPPRKRVRTRRRRTRRARQKVQD